MFQSGYQGGPYFEIFSTQGRDSTAKWKLSSSGIKKIYEKDVKGYVLTLEGTPATTKLQAPKDSKQTLTLVQRFLVVQLFVPRGADFSMEIGVTDLANNKRRLLLSSAQKETQVTPLHAKIPLAVMRRAVWMNLVLDMVSLVGETWTNQTFRSIDQLSISANCKVRRIFTMKSQPPDTTDDDEIYGCSSTNNGELDNIPKQCQMAYDVNHITQVITLNKIRCAERLKTGKASNLADQIRPGSMLELDLNSSGRRLPTTDGKIAFGSKAPKAPPDTGRKTARQGSLTNRSIRSQTSRMEGQVFNNGLSGSNHNISNMSESINNSNENISQGGRDSLDVPANIPHAPGSAGSNQTAHMGVSVYTRQQSEPVTTDDYSSVSLNGIKDSSIVAPHPPRQPSNDRVRRKPRVKNIGQRGDSSYLSPPTSALVGHHQPQEASFSPGQVSGVRVQSRSQLKDSGVGPDVPEIQSPRKGDVQQPDESSAFNEFDSVSDVISLLRGQEENEVGKGNSANSRRRFTGNESRRMDEERVEERSKEGLDYGMRGGHEENDSSSSSGSESSNPGEYEESDEEASTETNKLHFFISPPKSAPRRNISPATAETEINQSKKSFVKGFRSKIKKTSETSSQRGARLEDDFVSHSSSEDEGAGDMMHHHNYNHHHHHHHHHPHSRFRRHMGSAATSASLRNNHNHHPNANSGTTSGYNSINYTSPSSSHSKSSVPTSGRVSSQSRTSSFAPKTSASPDQRASFNPSLYADSGKSSNSVSRMNRRSLREISNPLVESKIPEGNNKQYDHLKYQADDLTESFERRMFASMRRQGEEVLEDVSPPPGGRNYNLNASQTLRSSSHLLNPSDSKMVHLYSESPATTSDDDTSFSTWKAPALNQVAHNYQDEMKSRRSSDTLTSSNPRDWSGVLSPPIDPLSQVQDLHGTMEGISDELSDEAPTANEKARKALTDQSEEEKLDLYFDPKLNCYYDPRTKKWYELLT